MDDCSDDREVAMMAARMDDTWVYEWDAQTAACLDETTGSLAAASKAEPTAGKMAHYSDCIEVAYSADTMDIH